MEDTLGEHKFQKYIGGRQIVWDASSFSTVQACPQLYRYKLEGYRSKVESIDPLWGSAVHRGMEVLDTHRFYGHSKDEAVSDAVQTILAEFSALGQSTDNKKNMETAIRAIVWRGEEFYSTDLMKIAALPNGDPALEVRFEIPFPGTEFRVSGKIDKVVWWENDLYIVDTKTTKSGLGDWYFNYFAPAVQTTCYIWATRDVLGMPVKGFIVDAIQTGVNFTRFGRAPFTVTPSQVDEWLTDTAITLGQVEKYHEIDHWPRNFNSCGNYGGCAFRGVCRNDRSHRSAFLDADFNFKPYLGTPYHEET
jgi:hypothetical protein